MAQWIIAGIALAGFVFNSGVLWNDVRHLKRNVEKLWNAVDEINKYLRNKK